jgi:ABC-2 type transport system permease protein
MEPLQWLAFFVAALLGSIPFALLGIALGYWFSAKAAQPVAMLLYLPLSYAGGLWMPPDHLPRVVSVISPFLPTRAYAELIWRASGLQTSAGMRSFTLWSALLAYTLLFAAIAWWGYRRDEGQRYH